MADVFIQIKKGYQTIFVISAIIINLLKTICQISREKSDGSALLSYTIQIA